MNVRFSQCCLILVGFVALSSLARADPKFRVQGSVPLRDRQNLPIVQRGGEPPGGNGWEAELNQVRQKAGGPWGDEEQRAFGHVVANIVRARGPWEAQIPIGALLNAPIKTGGFHVTVNLEVSADGAVRSRLIGANTHLINGIGHQFRMEGESGEYFIWYHAKDEFDNEITSKFSLSFDVGETVVSFVFEEVEKDVSVGWGRAGSFVRE